MDTPTTDFVRAGSLEELKAKGRLVVRGPHRPILVVYDKDRVFALDNRCPHMGFPLSMESASPDLLTLMAGRGFKRFKAISQYNFLPIECASCAPSYRAFSPRPAMCCRRAWCTHCFFDNVTESSLGAGETLVDDPPQKSCATYLNPRCSPEGYLARDLF